MAAIACNMWSVLDVEEVEVVAPPAPAPAPPSIVFSGSLASFQRMSWADDAEAEEEESAREAQACASPDDDTWSMVSGTSSRSRTESHASSRRPHQPSYHHYRRKPRTAGNASLSNVPCTREEAEGMRLRVQAERAKLAERAKAAAKKGTARR